MSEDHRLPLRELQKNKQYYQDSLQHLKNLRDAITNLLIPEKEFEMLTDELIYAQRKMRCELDEVEAKIDVQQYHLKVYHDRIEAYMPVFEKESAETNAVWDETWKKSKDVAAKFPMSPLARVVENFPRDGESNQEMKNEVFKVLKKQLAGYEETMRNKSKSSLKIQK
jgi:hypothetical protein